ncbi:unnamed protein product [Adineta steineri]|uniref:Uncharacterized protein n=1 Tax=Adineta steineri TaxID=433720 RepID=A0A818IIA3_9BILA|nr:unnamed protein product [Adineta steineri]CAF0847690.1 unnamed protein product [Adineta steineri]CAF0879019.1 unnamed protein product [Adineta steineri]CAF0889974.1 unnamed protein product [Adineta steineri]CAF0939295.1 unnamed protein product [Adineta steineri]
MSSNAAHQSNSNANVNEPPQYDKDRTVEGAPLKANELAEKCTSQTCGHDAVGGGTQETSNDNYGHRQ